jgi:ribonuclease HI
LGLRLDVYCDGSIRGGNPGGFGYAGYLVKEPDGQCVHQGAAFLGSTPRMSNNIAEYEAVKRGLEAVAERYNSTVDVVVYSDSQLIIYQLSGKWSCADAELMILRAACRMVAKEFHSVEYVWIPREQNKEADRMSKVLQNRRQPRARG